jgi:hypothetical protein
MEKNDIVSVITAAGEFIGKLDWETDTRLKLTDPRMLITTAEGMGFARGVCLTGVENADEMTFYSGGIVFVSPTNKDVQSSYHKFTSGIIV